MLNFGDYEVKVTGIIAMDGDGYISHDNKPITFFTDKYTKRLDQSILRNAVKKSTTTPTYVCVGENTFFELEKSMLMHHLAKDCNIAGFIISSEDNIRIVSKVNNSSTSDGISPEKAANNEYMSTHGMIFSEKRSYDISDMDRDQSIKALRENAISFAYDNDVDLLVLGGMAVYEALLPASTVLHMVRVNVDFSPNGKQVDICTDEEFDINSTSQQTVIDTENLKYKIFSKHGINFGGA